MQKKTYIIIGIGVILLISLTLIIYSSKTTLKDLMNNEVLSISSQANTEPEYYEYLIKTSDISLNKDKKDYSKEELANEEAYSSKQGYVIRIDPEGYNTAKQNLNLSKFIIIKVLASEVNWSLLEPEYDYTRPIFNCDIIECVNEEKLICESLKDEGERNKCLGEVERICNDRCISNNFEIKTERKYRIPLENILTEQQFLDLKSLIVQKDTTKKALIPNKDIILNVNSLIEKTNYTDIITKEIKPSVTAVP